MKKIIGIIFAFLIVFMLGTYNFCLAAKIPRCSQAETFFDNSSDVKILGILMKNQDGDGTSFYIPFDESPIIYILGTIEINNKEYIDYEVGISEDGKIISDHAYLMNESRDSREVSLLNEYYFNIFKKELEEYFQYCNPKLSLGVTLRVKKAFEIK